MGEIITCPSGLVVEIRGLTGKEIRLLTDQAVNRSGLLIDRLLEACVLKILECGPYQPNAAGKLDWSKVLIGDRTYLILRIRGRSFGNEYQVELTCKSCKAKIPHEVKLDELPTKNLEGEDYEAFKNGNELTGHLPDGTEFRFRLPVGADEVRYAKAAAAKKGAPSFIPAMISRITYLQGAESDQDKREFFENGEMRLCFDTLKVMESHDCGVVTKVEVECPECFEEVKVEIPFGVGFLAPT